MELVLVLKETTARFGDRQRAFLSLGARLDALAWAGVDLYYRQETDTALLVLHADDQADRGAAPAATAELLREELANLSAAILAPARLGDDSRARFRTDYLPLYELAVLGLPTVRAALRVLARHLGLRSDTPLPTHHRPPQIDVRFRHADGWRVGRVCALSHEGITIATGGPPRVGDAIELDLEVGSVGARQRLSVGAVVVQVTPREAALALGAGGFSARLRLANAIERVTLDEILAKVRGAVPGLPLPPRRRAIRFPLRWPLQVRAAGRELATCALDVSRHGLFVAAAFGEVAQLGSTVEVRLPLDDGESDLTLPARVARVVGFDVATQRRLTTGLGLELVGVPEEDASRFAGFLERIAARASRAIIVGAAPGRVEPLCAALAAAGYAARGATDPPSLMSKADRGCAPDLVLLDRSLGQGDARALRSIRRALRSRQLRSLRLAEDEPPTVARRRADAALLQ